MTITRLNNDTYQVIEGRDVLFEGTESDCYKYIDKKIQEGEKFYSVDTVGFKIVKDNGDVETVF